MALGWILEFLKPALNGVAGDRLRAKTSSEKARSRAFDLFNNLTRLQRESAALVGALEDLAATSDPDGPARQDASPRLRLIMGKVSSVLLDLAGSINRIDPQLSVHAPKIAHEVTDAMGSRSLVLTHLDDELNNMREFDPQQILAIARDARESLAGINDATEGLRVFLEGQFTFKESF